MVQVWDESLFAITAGEMVDSGDWIGTTFLGTLDYYNSKPPLNVWLITLAFWITEICLAFAVASFVFWFAPPNEAPDLVTLWSEDSGLINVALFVAYAVVTAFLEPFYVAAGFAMYLNRRAQLEAWDVEQELRRAFAV